jgi:hypothetical protein
MQVTRGPANPSWRWTDVRNDHQGVALILDDGHSSVGTDLSTDA